MTACIVGWAHSRFGKLEGETLESLITKVAADALEHAGIGPEDVDEIVLGHFNAGFSPQDFTASLVLQADDRLRFKPATRVENACATGSAAVRQGIRAIDASAHDRAGRRRRADDDDARPGDRQEPAARILSARGWRHARPGFAGVFGKIARPISSATATSRTRWRRSPPRTTGTASTIPMRRCARISASISAARRARRTPSSPGR